MVNTYIKPETQIVFLESQHIMAGSIGQVTNENPVTPGTEDARGFDLFFEEATLPENSDDEDGLWKEE